MIEAEQQTLYPASLRDWEHILTRELLRANGADVDPIRSFEVTPETLAKYCGLGLDHAAGAENAFRRALRADPYLYWSLQHGTYRTPTAQVPNCISILALSLLVDSLLDGEYEGKGQYREKLAQWLGVDRSFMNLRGIATMWGELVDWLDTRIEAGDSFRRLILPTIPGNWTHIGYTRFLSFPTKRDIIVLRKLIARKPEAVEDAQTFVLLFDRLIHSSSISFGMSEAYQDFRRALRAGWATTSHRFWRLVMRARPPTGPAEGPAATLCMEFDEDGGKHYRVTVVGSSDMWWPCDIGSAAVLEGLQTSPNLGPAARRGIFFFRSNGLASWTASGEPPAGEGPFHVAVADSHLRLAPSAVVSFEPTGTWHVTSRPVAAGKLNEILRSLGLLATTMSVRTIALTDGVRVGRSWLGWPRYLPVVEGAKVGIEIVRASGDSASGLTCVKGALYADGPVEGEFTVIDEAGQWARRISFVRSAEIHAQLDGVAYGYPLQEEWCAKVGRPAQVRVGETSWEERPYEHQDMVEAIYACARSGIGEGELVALIGRAVGGRTWDMLRLLQESTILEARLRERWRGRMFTLGRPTLTEIEIEGQRGVLASGAISTRLELDLRETVALHGGRAFRHLSLGSLAPPLVGAVGVGAVELAGSLGWAIHAPPSLLDGTVSTRLLETSVLGESYITASEWDWVAGRFRVDGAVSGPVSLVRLVHPGGRDHDIYRVTGRRFRTFTSRQAGILEAYCQAKLPLFRLEGDKIRRISSEGALPVEIAKILRLSTLRNVDALQDGWEYTVTPEDVRWLVGLLPGIVEGVASAAGDSALLYRRGRGARRPVWIAGEVVA